jgi:hypothetical protein
LCASKQQVDGCGIQDAKQGVRNLLSRHSLLAELQAKGVLNIIPQVPAEHRRCLGSSARF